MKKSLFLILGLITASVIWTNCSKSNEDLQVTKSNSTLASGREGSIDPFNTTKVRLNQGMLDFDNYRTYKEIYQNLRAIAKNPEAEQNAYQQLGYVTDSDVESNITDQPVLEKFEKQLNYVSARKVEENEFFNFLRQGGDPANFKGSFLYNTFLKSLLNQNNEVKIGSRIFKYIDDTKVVIIFNSDFSALQTVRNTPVVELHDSYNVHIWRKYAENESEFELFERDAEGTPRELSSICKVGFVVKNKVGSTFTFQNTSITEGTCEVTWDFGDGTPSLTGTPLTVISPVHTYAFGKLPATVKFTVTGKDCSCNKKSFSFTITENSTFDPPCDPDFDGKLSNGNVLDVTAPFNAPGSTFTWDFGDGGTGSGKTSQHVYSSNGLNTYPVTLKVSGPTGECFKTRFLSAGCGRKNAHKDDYKNEEIDGKKWRLAANIWCQNDVLGEEIGSSSKSFKRSAGIWWQKKADKLWVSIEGDYFEKVTTGAGNSSITQCGPENIPYLEETEDNSNYVARNIDVTNPSFLDRALKSTHRIKVGSKEWETPVLFLID